jgi:hypothetical protein
MNHGLKAKDLFQSYRYYSTFNQNYKMNPFFVTGFANGESCFYLSIYKNNKLKLGWDVQNLFTNGLHSRDLELLLKLKAFFGGIGTIKQSKCNNLVFYTVSTVKYLKNIIIPHF